MSLTSTTCRVPYIRLDEASFAPLIVPLRYTSSAMKTYFPPRWRQAVWVPRVNPGPLTSSTSLYSESRLYLNCETRTGLSGRPPHFPLPMSRITRPSFQ